MLLILERVFDYVPMHDKKQNQIKLIFRLKPKERIKVKTLLNRGRESVRVIKRAHTLELFDRGYTSPKIAEYVGVTAETVRRIGWNYIEGGLERALYDQSRPGKARALDVEEASRIIAMVCSNPPAGRLRWTVRLITEESVKRGIIRSIGRETIRILLKSHDLKPWREKNVVYPRDK